LKSDSAREYKSMAPLLRELGIRWDPCAPYAPSGNGFTGRMVRTVMENLNRTARTLLRKSPGKLGKMEERCDDGILMSVGDSRVARIHTPATNEFKHCRNWTVSEDIFHEKEQKGRARR